MRTAVFVVLTILGISAAALGQTPVVDFESLPEGQSAGTQISGVTFTNATVLQSAASLNETECPPRSGSKVVCDVGGAMRLVFNQPIKSFTGYITHAQNVTLRLVAANGGLITQTTAAGAINVTVKRRGVVIATGAGIIDGGNLGQQQVLQIGLTAPLPVPDK